MAEQIFNLKLVAEIEKYPCLYNYNLPQYSRKDITEKAWHDIGRAVNLSGNECKDRWKNLRAVFVRHLKPGSGNKTNKPYYLAESMQFTLPFIKTLTKTSAAQRAAKNQADTDSDQEDNLFTSTMVTTDRPSPSTSPSSQPPISSPPYWTNPTQEQDALAETPNGEARDSREEANRMFLLSLLPDMNLMTPAQVRSFKRRAMESIDELLESAVVKRERE